MKAQQIVLVIDQDPMMRETLKDVFAERPDYHLLTFQEAKGFGAAEELINSADLDVLVADVLTRQVPIGRELIEQAVTRHPNLAVVLVSADPSHYAENYPARAVCLRALQCRTASGGNRQGQERCWHRLLNLVSRRFETHARYA